MERAHVLTAARNGILPPDLPHRVKSLIQQMTSTAPLDRPSANQLLDSLKSWNKRIHHAPRHPLPVRIPTDQEWSFTQ